MNALLKASEGFQFGLPDAATFGQALLVFAVGIVTVFAVLIIIFLILSAFQVIFTGKKKEEKVAKPEPVPTPIPVAAPVRNDEEIIVAIAAAIAAAESEYGMKFKVVSFNRK